jgi:hypothetical protein
MAGTLANVGNIVASLLSPRQKTVVASTNTYATDTGEDTTLGRKKSPAVTTTAPGRQGKHVTVEGMASSQLVISPAFKLVVILVFVLILLSGAATVLLAIFGNSAALQSVSSVMSTTFTASVGAILGLIGGKAAV